jgi:hypothetical protein
MPDEHDFKDYKSIEEFSKTIEGTNYYHSLYMKAVSHPIRRRILKIIFNQKSIEYHKLLSILIKERIISDEEVLKYNLNYLIKALCIKEVTNNHNGEKYYMITQSGEVVDFLER